MNNFSVTHLAKNKFQFTSKEYCKSGFALILCDKIKYHEIITLKIFAIWLTSENNILYSISRILRTMKIFEK